LSHDQLDVLALEARVIHLFVVIIVLLGLLGFLFALSVIVVVACVVMTGVITRIGILGSSKLLGGIGLRLRVQVFNLGFTEDAR
jgi:hypothetical protein